ncbi:phosphate acyltransferase, partial [bacterium]|nr:phosphate acyltransferase [candidate division CSSED10-310 bacterium]
MEIIIDTLGGEKGPVPAVLGGLKAHSALGVDIAFVGNSKSITDIIRQQNSTFQSYRIIHTDQKILMSEPPAEALHQKPDASISLAMREVAEHRSHAIVSAGHTGATVVAARNLLGLLP